MVFLSVLAQILLLVCGFVVLIKGADFFVDGASAVATHFKIPKILIGLTIVAFGTSAPEFAVSVQSLLRGEGDLVLGNVVGSNILNILLILGACALVHDLKVKRETATKEIPMLALLTVLLAALLADSLFDWQMVNAFTRNDGLVVVMFFAIFIYYLLGVAKQSRTKKDMSDDEKVVSLSKALLFTVGGIIAIVCGSQWVVSSASALAAIIGASEAMIGLTVVALGTSLPELVTGLTATRKGEYDLALGNVVGSNIFNIGVVLGLPVALFGGIYSFAISYVDLLVMIVAALLLLTFALNDRKISRREGAIFLVLFVIYYAYTIWNGLSV